MGTPDLSALPLYRYRVDLTLARPLELGACERAVMWRGAFGAVLRSLACHDRDLDCAACALRPRCPYARFFCPTIPAGRPEIARLRDPPRPFVLADPRPEANELPGGVPVALGLAVVGTAVEDLPYFVVTLRKLGEDGVGTKRVRFRIESVRCVDACGVPTEKVFERGSDVVRSTRQALRATDLERPGDASAKRVRVRFVTPADVRGAAAQQGAAGEAPAFGVLVRRARDRLGALATFFGDGPLGIDPRAIGAEADGVRTSASEILVAEHARRSSRTGQRHPIRGVVGAAVYEGEQVAGAMPLLRLAEVVGVGKHATFGNGRIEVQVVG
jgi:hypothetical protein